MASRITKLFNNCTSFLRFEAPKSWGGQCISSFKGARCLSADSDIKYDKLVVEPIKTPKPKPDVNSLVFGAEFTDHMLRVEWNVNDGWGDPKITPFQNLSLAPSSSVLHYGLECFEGMKAYRGDDDKIRLFRPLENMKRLNRSADRSCLPGFDGKEFLKCLRHLISIEKEWVPYSNKCSLYLRPTLIGTTPALGVTRPTSALLYVILSPVGPYFKTGTLSPVALLADPAFVRAWPGGCGDFKLGGNYGPTILAQQHAEMQGLQQVLWLFGENRQVTEVGTMNIFMVWINEEGDKELITPPLNGLILPGITRKSLLEMAKNWGEFKVTEKEFTMNDIIRAYNENKIKEMFGAGTACVVSPVNRILFEGQNIMIPTMENFEVCKRFYEELTAIQYGRTPSPWAEIVD
ncbi:branched-chain-amino-acid aminotransferase-like [Acropora millepora]|uniref:branched-chain-amino-acid aminotransferase-like n=1 Tax=Acropora millepora TaxID=45264 RepID=UPI001CF3DAE2|nr:branched-chain-amino-acid aminotransferase-like [Acropora millepora]